VRLVRGLQAFLSFTSPIVADRRCGCAFDCRNHARCCHCGCYRRLRHVRAQNRARRFGNANTRGASRHPRHRPRTQGYHRLHLPLLGLALLLHFVGCLVDAAVQNEQHYQGGPVVSDYQGCVEYRILQSNSRYARYIIDLNWGELKGFTLARNLLVHCLYIARASLVHLSDTFLIFLLIED
jgi:hypothetical protein